MSNWNKLAPGVYDDGRGGVHIVMEELLEAAGYPPTPANFETLAAAARKLCQEQFPWAKIVEVEQ